MQYFCKNCGYIGKGVKRQKGSAALGCGLLIVGILTCGIFLIPWFVYELWRLTTKSFACPKCGSFDNLVPDDSPVAVMMMKNMGIHLKKDEQTNIIKDMPNGQKYK